jgi:hypothetical protein
LLTCSFDVRPRSGAVLCRLLSRGRATHGGHRHLLDRLTTADPHPADIRTVAQRRADRPLVPIDIAVARDVDPRVRTRRADIDDLERVVRTNLNGRLGAVEHAERIVEQELWRLRSRARRARRLRGGGLQQ